MPGPAALCHHGPATRKPTRSVTPITSTAPPLGRALRLARSATDRVLTGAAGGLGERLAVDPILVRVAFGVLTLAGGMGVLAYLLVWTLSDEPQTEAEVRRPPTSTSTTAFGLVVLGLLLVLRDVGLWLGNGIVWPAALAAVGSAVIWTRSDDAERARLSRLAGIGGPLGALFDPGRVTWVRMGAGALLVAIGMASFLDQAPGLLLAVMVTLLGAVLVLGPWIARLGRQVSDERRARIRSEERAEVAAHLHDSVLQTLALIQRTSEPGEMVALARGQERELRAWLYGRRAPPDADLLSTTLEEVAGRAEEHHQVKIEVVVVGDGPLDERSAAVVRAVGEAVTNAAAHSGADIVQVYMEVDPATITAYVTDEGIGFALADVSEDRRGIADSIVGRMGRYGGTATITSEPGEGTEVHLTVPRHAS